MSIDSWPKPKQEKEEEDGMFVAIKNPDGTYSRGGQILETPEQKQRRIEFLRRDQKEQEQKKLNEEKKAVQKRKEKITIPETVKPGSAEMVYRSLGVTLFVNKEKLDKTKQEGRQDIRSEALIKSQQLQLDVYKKVEGDHYLKLLSGVKDLKDKQSMDQVENKLKNLSAVEMAELVRGKIDEYTALLDKGEAEIYGLGPKMSIEDVIEAAEKLEAQLLQEASRASNDKQK